MASVNIRPVFTLELNHKLAVGKVTIGRYDGSHYCLTAVTNTDKVLIHSPHRRSALPTGRFVWAQGNNEVALLNMSQAITAILAAKVLPEEDKDVLVVGSKSHILVYHVHDNRDVFYKECVSGVNAVTVGRFSNISRESIILTGGNCAVHGYDHEGNEVFWSVTSDNVTDMILHDVDNDGENELIVGAEDFTIRIFKNTSVTVEINETDMITFLSVLPTTKFGYAIANGTIGIYEQDVRLWRVKSKNNAVALRHYDLLGKGFDQLITGWSNGKFDVRSIDTGDVLFKDHLNNPIAGVVLGDYRGLGKNDIIILTVEGEVRGFSSGSISITSDNVNSSENELIKDLFTRKQNLLLELKNYEANTRFNDENEDVMRGFDESSGAIPASTRLQIGISSDTELSNPRIEISISTNNNTIIRAVMIFAEGIFDNETLVVHPKQNHLSSSLTVPIQPPKDVTIDIHIKAFVGYPTCHQFHVFELTRQLPKFSMYSLMDHKELAAKNLLKTITENHVEFKVNDRIQRVCIWLNQNFLFPLDVTAELGMDPSRGPDFVLYLMSLRDKTIIKFLMEISGRVKIHTSSLQLASDLIQSLATFLNVEHMQVKAYFLNEEENLKMYLESLVNLQETKIRLNNDMAEKISILRNLIIRAEDSRVNCIEDTIGLYNEIKSINDDLLTSHNIRLQNHNDIQDAMKNINLVVQKAARIRVGKFAANVINDCKNAIKSNNFEALVKIIRTGQA